MGAHDVLARLSALGVRLTREGEVIRAAPRSALTDEARALIRAHKLEILAALKEAANEMFCFSPPGDSANDNEALQERAAIMIEGNGWDAATALREARWQADKERCWRVFLLNARRVLDAPEAHREGLLARYQVEATGRYGQAAGANIAGGLRAWVKARGVH